MGSWKESVFSILVVSVSVSVLLQVIPDTGGKELLHILCGVLLTVVILGPITEFPLEDFLNFQQYVPESPDALLDAGRETADAAKRQYITDRLESYILDKAKAMGAEILPEVCVDEACMPVYAEIHGEIAPQIQKTLEQILIGDLGITKENQRWTGNPEEEN